MGLLRIGACICAAIVFSFHAEAASVSKPQAGITYSANNALAVQWTGLAGSNVLIQLTTFSVPGIGTVSLSLGTFANSGNASVASSVFRNMVCNIYPKGWAILGSPVPANSLMHRVTVSNAVNTNERANSGDFRFKCPRLPTDPVQMGSGSAANLAIMGGALTVIKKLVNATTLFPPPTTSFTVDVVCTPNGPSLPVTLNASNNHKQTVTGIKAGSSCTINEVPPAVPDNLRLRGCGWQTSYPDGKTAGLDPGETLTRHVVNRWDCKPGSNGGNGDGDKDKKRKASPATPVYEPPADRAPVRRERPELPDMPSAPREYGPSRESGPAQPPMPPGFP